MASLVKNWRLVVLRGLLAVLLGLTAFLWPRLTLLVLIVLFGIYALADGLVAAWAVLTGVFEIAAAIRLRLEINNEWLLRLGGPLSIAFGVLLVLQPAAGGLALIWIIGAYEVLFGVLLIALASTLGTANSLRLAQWLKQPLKPFRSVPQKLQP